MKETGVIRRRVSGPEAAPYMNVARNLLGMVKQQIQFGGLSQLSRTVDLPNGVRITVMSIFGQDEVRISVPIPTSVGSRIKKAAVIYCKWLIDKLWNANPITLSPITSLLVFGVTHLEDVGGVVCAEVFSDPDEGGTYVLSLLLLDKENGEIKRSAELWRTLQYSLSSVIMYPPDANTSSSSGYEYPQLLDSYPPNTWNAVAMCVCYAEKTALVMVRATFLDVYDVEVFYKIFIVSLKDFSILYSSLESNGSRYGETLAVSATDNAFGVYLSRGFGADALLYFIDARTGEKKHSFYMPDSDFFGLSSSSKLFAVDMPKAVRIIDSDGYSSEVINLATSITIGHYLSVSNEGLLMTVNRVGLPICSPIESLWFYSFSSKKWEFVEELKDTACGEILTDTVNNCFIIESKWDVLTNIKYTTEITVYRARDCMGKIIPPFTLDLSELGSVKAGRLASSGAGYSSCAIVGEAAISLNNYVPECTTIRAGKLFQKKAETEEGD